MVVVAMHDKHRCENLINAALCGLNHIHQLMDPNEGHLAIGLIDRFGNPFKPSPGLGNELIVSSFPRGQKLNATLFGNLDGSCHRHHFADFLLR